MKTVGLSEARQKFSELVDRASRGERIGITRRGKLVALLIPAQNLNLKQAFARGGRLRKRVKPLPKGVRSKSLIDEGQS